jgi:putative endonuclease
MTFYLYILWSEVSDLYYVGYTSDYEKRLLEHNTGVHDTFTSKHRPWLLKAVFSCESKLHAIRVERFIKRQKSRKLIEKLILGDDFDGELAQLVRVPYVRD